MRWKIELGFGGHWCCSAKVRRRLFVCGWCLQKWLQQRCIVAESLVFSGMGKDAVIISGNIKHLFTCALLIPFCFSHRGLKTNFQFFKIVFTKVTYKRKELRLWFLGTIVPRRVRNGFCCFIRFIFVFNIGAIAWSFWCWPRLTGIKALSWVNVPKKR